MDLLEKSRRFFKFKWDKNWKFDFGHIKANNGTIWFQRPAIPETHRFTFDSVKSCKLWAYRFGMAMMEGFVANKRVDKNLYEVKTSALTIDETEWSKVAKYMTNPDRFDRDNDIKIFESYLANNFRDRDGERFPKSVLKSFEKSIVGKGKLMGHKWGDPGNGRFYSAEIVKMGVDEALLFINAQPDKNFKKHLEFIEKRDGGIFWLVTRYYMPNVTDLQKEAIIFIESGVWKDMSIGFRAPLKYAIFQDGKETLVRKGKFGEDIIDGDDDKDNPLMFLEFRNDKNLEAEALEGSHVFLGSQFGARTTKSVNELENQIKALNGKLDKIISKSSRKKKTGEPSAVSDQPSAKEDEEPSAVSDQRSAKEDEFISLDDLPGSDLPLPELMEKFYWDLVAQELKWWKSQNKPVGFDDFMFICNRRGFEDRHILFLIEELKKLDLAENLIVIAENFDKYFTFQKGNFLIPLEEIEDEELKYYVAEIDKKLATGFLESSGDDNDSDKDNEGKEKENENEKETDVEKKLRGELKAVWTTAYVNTLKDDCFAYVEDIGKYDDEGRTIPKSARHLPHHPKGGGATDTGGIVDLPHLRNALARVNQVNPVTDKVSAERMRSLAKSHLVAHAKKLNVGDYELVYDTVRRNAGGDGNSQGDGVSKGNNDNSDKIITVAEGDTDVNGNGNGNVNVNPIKENGVMKEFKFESFGVDMTVNDEKFDENMKALHNALVEKETALNQEVADLTKKVSDFEDKAAAVDEQLKGLNEQVKQLSEFSKSVKDVFGDDVTAEDLKRAKDTESLYRQKEIERAIRYGGPIGLIKDQKKELEFYNGMSTEQITKFADKYQSDFEIRYPEYAGVLKANNEELVTNSGNKPEEKPEIEEPLQHFRW